MGWWGYIVLTKSDSITQKDWEDKVIPELCKKWNTAPKSENWAARLWPPRFSHDKTKCIIESTFDERDLDTQDLTRLPKYMADALNAEESVTTVEICKDALTDKVTCFDLGHEWSMSGDACREYIAKNNAEWERPLEFEVLDK